MDNQITHTDYLRAQCHLLEHGWLFFYTEKQLEYWRSITEQYEEKLKKDIEQGSGASKQES